MTSTKAEALKRIDELEEKLGGKIKDLEGKVELLKKGSDVLERRALEQAEEIQQEKRRADNLLSQRNDLQRKLDGYGDLAKALGKIRGESMDVEQVRKVVREEFGKLPGFDTPTPGEGVRVTESVPYVDLKVSSPWLTLDESTVEGQVAVMALHDKLPGTFNFSDVIKGLNKEYSVGPRRQTVQKGLDALVGKYKALERKVQGNQWVYTLRSDAKSRVKESETREPARAKEIS